MLRWSVSSWSLHGPLSSGWPLTELPAEAAKRGIATLEICHFHLQQDRAAFRQAVEDAGVELFSVLIDTGDIASPDGSARAADLAVTRHWIDVAAELGAKGVRVDAGSQPPTEDAIARSSEGLLELSQYGRQRGVWVFTENWRETSRQAGPLLKILDGVEGIGLCVDTGNAEGPEKEATLRALAPRGTSCHFKARYTDGKIDQEDLRQSAEILLAAGFSGPISIIYDRDGGGWEGVEALKAALTPVVGLT